MKIKPLKAIAGGSQAHKRWQRITTVVALTFFMAGCDELARINELPIAKGHTAKQLCSFTFNTSLEPRFVQWKIVAPDVSIFPLIWQTEVDRNNHQVAVKDFVFLNESLTKRSVYRPGMGCTVLVDKTPEQLIAEQIYVLEPPLLDPAVPWPNGGGGLYPAVIPGIDYVLLDQVVDQAFVEDREIAKNTSSILVAYDGKLIAEQYDFGVTAEAPVIGWSMTKSITGAYSGDHEHRFW